MRLASTIIHNKKLIQATKSYLLYNKINKKFRLIIILLSRVYPLILKLTKTNKYDIYLIEYNYIFIKYLQIQNNYFLYVYFIYNYNMIMQDA